MNGGWGVQSVMRDPTRHPVMLSFKPTFPCWTSPSTLRNDDEANGAVVSPSLTEVGALDDPEVTLAAKGARGEIGGRVRRGGAFFLVPHHCHHSAAVLAVHGKVPEDLLLEGQGRGRGEQPDRAQPQQEGAMWQHPCFIFLTEDTQQKINAFTCQN